METACTRIFTSAKQSRLPGASRDVGGGFGKCPAPKVDSSDCPESDVYVLPTVGLNKARPNENKPRLFTQSSLCEGSRPPLLAFSRFIGRQAGYWESFRVEKWKASGVP